MPTITGVSSTATDRTYRIGEEIEIQVAFSEAVKVTGTPQLTLETGTTDRVAVYEGGDGTSTLTFSYTVQAGDSSADLDYLGTSALSLNSGSIEDTAGNDATLTLPEPGTAGAISDDQAIVVDGIAPTVTGVTASSADGLYNVGDTISIAVAFSENITVEGTPQLTLHTGAVDRVVDHVSVKDGNTLTFSYTVQAGDTSADLDFASAAALALNGGAIRDAAGNDATLTLAQPGAAGSLGAASAIVVDGIAPTLTSAVLDDQTLVLTFADTHGLDGANPPAVGAFSVMVDGKALPVTAVAVDGGDATVTLTINGRTPDGKPVTVSYADPSAADDSGAIQDGAGNDAASFTDVLVTRPDSGGEGPGPGPKPDPDPGSGSGSGSDPDTDPTDTNGPGTGGSIASASATGAAERGSLLTAVTSTITDPEGIIAGSFSYQWLRDGQAITGARSATYLPPTTDMGHMVGVQVSYADMHGHIEKLLLGPRAIGDADIVIDDAETLIPGLLPTWMQGDGNGDGVGDQFQPHVVSGPVVPGPEGFMALAGQEPATISLVQLFDAAMLPLPADAVYPGAAGFQADGLDGSMAFSFFARPSVDAPELMLLGRDWQWHQLGTHEVVGAGHRFDFTLEDGGSFDLDGVVNGSVQAVLTIGVVQPVDDSTMLPVG